jgi:hypothetical protein
MKLISPPLRVWLTALVLSAAARMTAAQPWRTVDLAESRVIKAGAATVQVDLGRGSLDLPNATIFAHVQKAVDAIVAYYGRFPVARARILILPSEGRDGVMQGTTWGGVGGYQGFTRIRIGQHTTAAELDDDWMMTHELVHMAFPSMPDDQHWIEEGQATYIEPIARVMTGELKAAEVWRDMARDMAKGEPQPGDEGLDRTHTWARTYWGGALFCLVADVAIRRETGNKKGLQDALRAVVAQGGAIDQDWELPRALAIGDAATGTHVLTQMYAEWGNRAVPVDLTKLWDELGVRATADGVALVPTAPLTQVREGITRGDRVK